MRMLLTGLALTMMAGVAMAQTVTPADPAQPAPMDTMASPPPAEAPPASDATALVQRDGKWWNGDREATKDEIAAHKKTQKAGKPG